MKPLISALCALLCLSAAAGAQAASARVWADKGGVFYQGEDGRARRITNSSGDRDPALSPDGRRIAYVHFANPNGAPSQADRSTLWVYDLTRNSTERAAAPRASTRPGRDFTRLHSPTFSNDGRTVYVMALAWVTSDSIHAVDLQAHAEHFVTEGNSLSVIRNGPYRSDLLVSQHRYKAEGGAIDPTFVIKPDGKEVMMVPGSDGANDEAAVAAWLRKGGWSAD